MFYTKRKCIPTMVDIVFHQVLQCEARRSEFDGYSSAKIFRSWNTLFEDGRRKVRHNVSWIPPPQGILKLNFDSSYVRESGNGGIGGVIRDHLGTGICTFKKNLITSINI